MIAMLLRAALRPALIAVALLGAACTATVPDAVVLQVVPGDGPGLAAAAEVVAEAWGAEGFAVYVGEGEGSVPVRWQTKAAIEARCGEGAWGCTGAYYDRKTGKLADFGTIWLEEGLPEGRLQMGLMHE